MQYNIYQYVAYIVPGRLLPASCPYMRHYGSPPTTIGTPFHPEIPPHPSEETA
jgi:hypothetical protein